MEAAHSISILREGVFLLGAGLLFVMLFRRIALLPRPRFSAPRRAKRRGGFARRRGTFVQASA